jgi:hypothetical protein
MDFQEIKNNAIVEQAKNKAIKDKIVMRQRQIYRLENKLNRNRAWWGDILIRPIMVEVKAKFPQLSWDDERLIPMGLRCAVSLFGHDVNGKTVAMIVFTPGKSEDGEIYIDTKEINYIYPPNSIGGLNGFGNVTKLVTSLEDVYAQVDQCIERNKEKLN